MTILIILLAIVTLVLLVAVIMPKNHFVQREVTINSPQQIVFDFIKYIGNQELFNTNAMTDTDREKTFSGTDGTVGYVYAWKGNKDAGEGQKEIIAIEEGKSVEMEIRFTKPMKATARIIMQVKPAANGQTLLTWSNAGRLPIPINLFIPKMQKHVAGDMDKSLANLKNILEK